MDPLSSINNAYSIVLRVEKQRSVHMSYPGILDNASMLTKTTGYGGENGNKLGNVGTGFGAGIGKGSYRKSNEEKTKLIYDHYKDPRHKINDCFKLHGYPEWYKRFKDQKGRTTANHVDDRVTHRTKTIAIDQGNLPQLSDMASIIQ